MGIHKYDGKGSFEGWIKRVFVNYIIDCQRKNRRAKQEVVEADAEMYPELSNDNHSQDEDVFDIIEYASGVLTREDIMHSIAGLPEVFRIVFNLFHIEELDHKEIAELLGIETTTSRTRLARARKLLKDNLLTCMEEKTGEKVNYARG